MNFIIEVADKVLNGGEVTRVEAERLINVSDDDTMLLLAMADKIRQKYNGNAVDCCAIINGRSGVSRNLLMLPKKPKRQARKGFQF